MQTEPPEIQAEEFYTELRMNVTAYLLKGEPVEENLFKSLLNSI